MSKNYAVIDIGTLKVKLLIASIAKNGELVEKYSSNILTCFGCEMDKNNGFVLEENLIKTINELKRCKTLLKKYNVKKFRVVSTHAMRRALNRDEILKRIKKEAGFDVENISQGEEAKLFFKAVMRDFQKDHEYTDIDMGGGSVQVLTGTLEKLKSTHLMQTGAQYLHDNYTKNSKDPKSFTTPKDIEKMKEYILQELLPLKKESNLPIIYGSSNIIDLMKAIELPLDSHKDSKSHPYKTYSEHLEKFIDKMLPLPYFRRESLFNFQKGYMWGIDKAFLNVVTISNYLKSPYIIPSNANIGQGFIYSIIEDIVI